MLLTRLLVCGKKHFENNYINTPQMFIIHYEYTAKDYDCLISIRFVQINPLQKLTLFTEQVVAIIITLVANHTRNIDFI